ncbi:TetR/AcrR family transcriptional regulator [Microbacteriaceae bacterium VKM Ac-2854]|nr:TetR/AcrR family transcriptional regulator [Microbacteriaceae bacterium VKM Ac-2854]
MPPSPESALPGNPARPNRGPSAGPENRRALVEAARAVFAEDGLAAPLSAVAKRARVGQGSLYRHFPDRIALAVAVFEENVDELEALAADPAATLTDLFDAVTEQALVSTALIELLSAAREDTRADRLNLRVAALIEAVLARDQAAGRIRSSVEPADVLIAISMLTLYLPQADARADVARRARAIFRAAFVADAERSAG